MTNEFVLCAVALATVFWVFIPVFQALRQHTKRNYEEKFAAYKVLTVKRYYQEARSIPVEVLFDNMAVVTILYDSIGYETHTS